LELDQIGGLKLTQIVYTHLDTLISYIVFFLFLAGFDTNQHHHRQAEGAEP